jgi:hypothetical protein
MYAPDRVWIKEVHAFLLSSFLAPSSSSVSLHAEAGCSVYMDKRKTKKVEVPNSLD